MKAVYEAIQAVDLEKVPVMSTDRLIPRKQQAALARSLLKRLGIKGISVTAPRYSMAQAVHVELPAVETTPEMFFLNGINYQHHSYYSIPDDVPAKIAIREHYQASEKLGVILLRAFPKHDNRSDYQSDYFDYCWSIN